MKISILAIGRLKAGPERDLFERYHERAAAAGRRLGFAFAANEFPESRAGSAEARKDQEAEVILAKLPRDAMLVALDEHGAALDSIAFAERLRGWRDGGKGDVGVAIGGPDGLGKAVSARADLRLAFGTMT